MIPSVITCLYNAASRLRAPPAAPLTRQHAADSKSSRVQMQYNSGKWKYVSKLVKGTGKSTSCSDFTVLAEADNGFCNETFIYDQDEL